MKIVSFFGPQQAGKSESAKKTVHSHASESDWVDFTADAVIQNTGSVEELREKAVREATQ